MKLSPTYYGALRPTTAQDDRRKERITGKHCRLDEHPLIIRAALALGANTIELNTARYSDLNLTNKAMKESMQALEEIRHASEFAHSNKMQVLAGHGLTYRNVKAIAAIPQIVELNIGHNIISRAALAGLDRADREMLALLD